MKFFFQLSEQALVWKINLMARKPWETELGSGQDWSSSNIAAFRCIEKLDKLVSTSEKYYFYIGWTVHRGFCASFPSVFPILQMKTECIGTMEFFSELKDQYISMWALPLFFFLLFFQHRQPRYLKLGSCLCCYKHLAGKSAEGESLLCDDKIKDCTNGEN